MSEFDEGYAAAQKTGEELLTEQSKSQFDAGMEYAAKIAEGYGRDPEVGGEIAKTIRENLNKWAWLAE